MSWVRDQPGLQSKFQNSQGLHRHSVFKYRSEMAIAGFGAYRIVRLWVELWVGLRVGLRVELWVEPRSGCGQGRGKVVGWAKVDGG